MEVGGGGEDSKLKLNRIYSHKWNEDKNAQFEGAWLNMRYLCAIVMALLFFLLRLLELATLQHENAVQ